MRVSTWRRAVGQGRSSGSRCNEWWRSGASIWLRASIRNSTCVGCGQIKIVQGEQFLGEQEGIALRSNLVEKQRDGHREGEGLNWKKPEKSDWEETSCSVRNHSGG